MKIPSFLNPSSCFFFGTFSVLILWQQKSFLEMDPDKFEIITAAVGIVIGITWVTVAYLAIMKEKKWLTYVFFTLSVFSPVEVIINIVRVSINNLRYFFFDLIN